jgi:hypothetical protein
LYAESDGIYQIAILPSRSPLKIVDALYSLVNLESVPVIEITGPGCPLKVKIGS